MKGEIIGDPLYDYKGLKYKVQWTVTVHSGEADGLWLLVLALLTDDRQQVIRNT